jgi:predicted dehydrogenase
MKLRIGIIGCGNVLEAYVPQCEKLARRGLAELVLGCGRESQRARALAQGIPRFTTEPAEVLGARDIDLVVILTSIPTHAAMASAALEAGQHVLLEKPLATTLADGQKLLRLSQSSRGLLAVAPFTLLSPTCQAMGRRLHQGAIGRPCSARARYGWSGPWWSDWFYQPGGGCLFDVGVYCLTTLTGLLGPVRRVAAMAGVAIPERTVKGRPLRVEAEDNAQVLLDFGQACFAVVTTGFTLQQYRSPALELYGTEGTLQMLGDDWDPEGYEMWQNSAGAWQIFKETAPDWPWTDGLRHLVECIHGGTKPITTAEHALHVLELMVNAQEASRSGTTVPVTTTFAAPRFEAVAPGEAAHLLHDRTRDHIK